MRRGVRSVAFLSVLICGLMIGSFGAWGTAAADESAVLQAGRAFVQAAAKGDSAAVGKLLGAVLACSARTGKRFSRAGSHSTLPKTAMSGDVGGRNPDQ